MKTKRLRAKPIIYSICLLRLVRHVQEKKAYLLIILASTSRSQSRSHAFLRSFPRIFEEKRDCSQSSFNLTFGLKPQVGGIKIVTV